MNGETSWTFGEFELRLETFELLVGGIPQSIEPKALNTLLFLAQNRQRVVERSELHEKVWGGAFVSDAAISQAVQEARRAVGDSGRSQSVVKTVHGRGYRFVASVVVTLAGARAAIETPVAGTTPDWEDGAFSSVPDQHSRRPFSFGRNVGFAILAVVVITSLALWFLSFRQGLGQPSEEELRLTSALTQALAVTSQALEQYDPQSDLPSDVQRLKTLVEGTLPDLLTKADSGLSTHDVAAAHPAAERLPNQLAELHMQAAARELPQNKARAAEHLIAAGEATFLVNTKRAEESFRWAAKLDASNSKAIYYLARIDLRKGRMKEASDGFGKLLQPAKSTGPWKLVGMVGLGTVALRQAEFPKAASFFKSALAADESLREQRFGMYQGGGGLVATAYHGLGVAYRSCGDLESSEAMFSHSLKIAQDLSDQRRLATAHANLGEIYFARGDLRQAEHAHLEALQILTDFGGRPGMAHHYNALGDVYKELGELEESERHYTAALKINRNLGHRLGIATQQANLGRLHLMRGELSEAEVLLSKALKEHHQLARQKDAISVATDLGMTYVLMGRLQASQTALLNVIENRQSLQRAKSNDTNSCSDPLHSQPKQWASARTFYQNALASPSTTTPAVIRLSKRWLEALGPSETEIQRGGAQG